MTVLLGAGAVLLLAGLVAGLPSGFRNRAALAAVAVGGVLILAAAVTLLARSGTFTAAPYCGTAAFPTGCGPHD